MNFESYSKGPSPQNTAREIDSTVSDYRCALLLKRWRVKFSLIHLSLIHAVQITNLAKLIFTCDKCRIGNSRHLTHQLCGAQLRELQGISVVVKDGSNRHCESQRDFRCAS